MYVPEWMKFIFLIDETNEHILNELKKLKNLKKNVNIDDKIFSSKFKKIFKSKVDSKNEDIIALEWKQIAGKINKTFFIVLILVIESTPFLLFAKYYISDETINICGCKSN